MRIEYEPSKIFLADGIITSLAARFISDENSGVYWISADTWAVVAGGVEVARFVEAGGDIQLQVDIGGTAPASAPALSIGIGGITGFTSLQEGRMSVVTSGSESFEFLGTSLRGANVGCLISSSASSATIPSLCPDRGDGDSGIGQGTDDTLSIIAGGAELIRAVEAADDYVSIVAPDAPAPPHVNGAYVVSIDEVGHNLIISVKYSDGTTKTATIALT